MQLGVLQFLDGGRLESEVYGSVIVVENVVMAGVVSLLILRVGNICKLLLENGCLVVVDELNLLVLNHLLDVFVNLLVVQSSLNVLLVLGSHFFGKSAHQLVLNGSHDFQERSLGPHEEQLASSVFHLASFDVLV